ncbi:endonuclease/exonuclease/phosphatase family protein [Brevibacillus sp. TJ4]|uniref:endonuclease/exonuclease/phosphatase family protein n=1 Tax=Brevibacillus sp. TJ4 TaxID=3234853 RepID=UPI0037D40010
MIRIVSYNIHSGRDLFWRKRLRQMAETLHATQADVICLQEVHQNSKFGNQADYLASELQYNMSFSPSIGLGDGAYGNALLTRHPVLHSRSLPLPARREKRTLQEVTLRWKETTILIGNTHCSLFASSRNTQLHLLRAWAQKQGKTSPLLLLGDFNSSAVSLSPPLQDCAVQMGKEQQSTLPSFKRRLDYVFASSHWHVLDYKVVRVSWSDHLPIIAELELSQSPAPEG